MLLTNELHKDTLSAYIELYELDASAIGGSTYHFTNSLPESGNTITYDNIDYILIPIEISGLSVKSDGSPARPQMIIDNVSRILLSAVISLGDLVGAKLIRKRTFAKFLDNGSDPNPNAYVDDVYYISQKTSHTPSSISFELCSALELTDIKIPGRQCLKRDFPALGRF